MEGNQINPRDVKIDPNDKRYTIPRTWGVWEVTDSTGSKIFRTGNNPIRETELIRELGSSKLVSLHLDPESAKNLKRKLNAK